MRTRSGIVGDVEKKRFEFRYDRWCGWFLGVLGMGSRHSEVTVDDRGVTAHMGWAFRADIPRDRIATVAHDERKVWGWGVHGWSGRWLVNGSSCGVVRLTIDPPVSARVAFVHIKLRELRVSLDQPDRFLDELSVDD